MARDAKIAEKAGEAALPSVYLNPKGPTDIFFRYKKFDDLVEYVPRAELEKCNADFIRISRMAEMQAKRLDELEAERNAQLRIFRTPYEKN